MTRTLPATVAHIAELWRYPVKGMRGEQVDALEVVADGIAQDRRYAFESSGAPAGKPMLTSRERAAMLLYAARVSAIGVEVTTPEGAVFGIDDPALTDAMEAQLPQRNRVALKRSGPQQGPFTDVRPVALLSAEALAQIQTGYGCNVDARRFRANVVLRFSAEALAEFGCGALNPFPEDRLTGCLLQIGRVRLRVLERVPRCRIVTLDPATATPEPELMKYLDRKHKGRVGVYAKVEQPGWIYAGGAVSLEKPPPFAENSRPIY